jgi:hypothetical protein
LKLKHVVAQSTTAKRSGITVGHQLRWFKCYSGVIDKLIARGMDETKLTKKDIIAVLAVYYGKQETDKKNNPILTELLKAEMELNEHV